MPTDETWQIPLPDPQPLSEAASAAFADEIDQVLLNVVRQVRNKYSTHGITALPTKTTRLDPDQTVVLSYALYLSFSAQNDFSYRLFELISHAPNGGLPVQVQAFSGPPVPFGGASTPAELQQVINQIFDHTRTRWIINAYYKS